MNLTGNVQTVNAGITTTGNGVVTFSNAGQLTLNGDIVADGAVTQNGAGAVTIMAPRTISTTSDAVNFLRAVTLAGGGSGLVNIDTRVSGAGGDITFQSTLDASTAAPNAETLTLNAGDAGNILFTGAVGSGTRLGAIDITNANDVTETNGVTAASLVQAAGQGTTTFNGAVNTNTATGVNLTGNVQTVNAGITTTGSGLVTFSNAGQLTLNGDIVADGAVTQNTSSGVALNANVTTTSDLVSFAGPVTLGGGARTIDTSSGGGGDINFGNSLDGGGNDLTLNAGDAGNITFNGAITNFGALNLSQVNNLALLGGFSGTGLIQASGAGSTTLGGVIVTNGPQGIAITTNGTITVTGQISTNDNPVTFNASNWNFGGSTITAGTQPITISQVSNGTINIGSQLDTADLAALATSNQLYVGGISNTGIVNIDGSANFAASTPNVTLRATGAGGKITQTNASAVIGSPPALLTLDADSGIGAQGAPIRLTGANVAANNASAGDIVLQFPSGNVNLQGQFNNDAPGGSVEVVTSNGGITTATTLSSDGTLTLTASSNGAPAPLDIDANGITATGSLTLRAADTLTIDSGNGLSSGGDVTLIAGLAPGMTGMNAVTTVSPASAPDAFRESKMFINGPVHATGNITIASTGAVTQSPSNNAGLQSSSGTSNGNLKAVTFNDAGAPISLKNNSTGGIGTCANATGSGNCAGTIQIEARFADGRITEYAPADIDYQGIGTISVQSVGTGADARLVSQALTLPTSSIVARHASFYATGGNIDLTAQIDNSRINRGGSGGSLNLFADGDVNVSAPASPEFAGVTIGKRAGVDDDGTVTAEPFQHDLTLTATGDLNIAGSIYLAADLNLRADASSGEVAQTAGAPALGDGVGSVRLQTQPASHYGANGSVFPLEVKANNIVVGTKQGSTVYPVQNLEISTTLPGLPADGSAQRADALLSAKGGLEVYLRGDLSITAGRTQAVTTATGQSLRSTAVAAMEGHDVIIRGVGSADFAALTPNRTSIFLKAGEAFANNGVGGDTFAAADAVIIASGSKKVDIGGDFRLEGGSTRRERNSNLALTNLVSAQAFLDPATMQITTGGNVVLIGGLGPNASAKILNSGDIKLSIGGNAPVTYVNPLTNETGTVSRGGLVIIGGPGSGIFDSFNNPISLAVPPVEVSFIGGGGYTLLQYPTILVAPAYIQSGPSRNFNSLLAYILYAANEETRVTRVRAGVSAKDDTNLPACN